MNDAARDRAAWIRSLVERHEGPLTRYAARLTGDVERARDVVQDAFCRLLSEPRARVDGHEAEWLFTVCRNRALDVLRKEGRMHPTDDEALGERESHEPSPTAVIEEGEGRSTLLSLLGALPARQQELLRLKFQEGRSYKEIAAIAKLSVSNVGFILHTALKTLRERAAERSSL